MKKMQKTLTEKEAEDFLEKEGFDVVKRAIIKKEEDIKEAEKIVDYPWVMKASSRKLAHKAKFGGVILGISNQINAQVSFDQLAKLPDFEEAIIQEIADGEEVIIGLKKTPEFGHVLMFGKGGSKVEEEKDVSFRVLPLGKRELEELIKEPRIYKILEEKQANMALLKKSLLKTMELAKKYPNLLELDINPLFVSQKKARIADARIIFED
jgi:succinyl-CoA synthetase beta subunit